MREVMNVKRVKLKVFLVSCKSEISMFLQFLPIVSSLVSSIAIVLRVGLVAFFQSKFSINIGRIVVSSGDIPSGESTFGRNNRIPVKYAGRSIGHFTVVCLVTWPWIGSEAGGDHVLIQTSLLFICDHSLLMLTSLHLHMKNNKVCIYVSKQGQPQPRFQS